MAEAVKTAEKTASERPVVVSAVGLCFMHPEAGSDVSTCCLRVRDCDEVVLIAETCEHDFETDVTEATCTTGGYTTYTCTVCGYTYDEAKEGVPFESLPEDWVCPLCKHPKSDFVLQG